MIRAELGLGILGTALWIYCLLDVIMADESRIRNLGKSTWIWVVLVTSVVGDEMFGPMECTAEDERCDGWWRYVHTHPEEFP